MQGSRPLLLKRGALLRPLVLSFLLPRGAPNLDNLRSRAGSRPLLLIRRLAWNSQTCVAAGRWKCGLDFVRGGVEFRTRCSFGDHLSPLVCFGDHLSPLGVLGIIFSPWLVIGDHLFEYGREVDDTQGVGGYG